MDLVITREVSGETLNTIGACTFVLGTTEKEGFFSLYVLCKSFQRRLSIGRVDVAQPRGEACSLGLWGLWQRSGSTEMLMGDRQSELDSWMAGAESSCSKIHSPSGSALPSLSGTVKTPTTRWPSLRRWL